MTTNKLGEKMKDIKSVMIGFLLATCCFLFMGQTSNDRGKFQGFASDTSVYLLDTDNGALFTTEVDPENPTLRYWLTNIKSLDIRVWKK